MLFQGRRFLGKFPFSWGLLSQLSDVRMEKHKSHTHTHPLCSLLIKGIQYHFAHF